MATGIHTSTFSDLDIQKGLLPKPSRFRQPESWQADDIYEARLSVETAFARSDFAFLTRAIEQSDRFPPDGPLKLGVQEYTARICNWLGHYELALKPMQRRYFRAFGIERLKCAITYAEALVGLERPEEASDILNSNPPPKRWQPKGRLRTFLWKALAPKAPMQLSSYFKATLACRHTIVQARIQLSRSDLDLAAILFKGASQMEVAPLYGPLLRAQCAYFLACCNKFEDAESLLRLPLEHEHTSVALDLWTKAGWELLDAWRAQEVAMPHRKFPGHPPQAAAFLSKIGPP